MSDYSGFTPPDDTLYTGGLRLDPKNGATLDPPGPSTIYYRTSGGSRGTATSASGVPAGAVIERVTR